MSALSSPTQFTRMRQLARHASGILALAWLPLVWFSFSALPRQEANWQRATRNLADWPLRASNTIILSVKTGSLEATGEENWLEWSGSAVEGTQFVQITVRGKAPRDWNRVLLQFIGLQDNEPSYDTDLIHHRTRQPKVVAEGESWNLTWQLPRPTCSFRLLIPSGSTFQIEHVQLAGVSPEQARRATGQFLVKMTVAGVEGALLLAWLAAFVVPLQRLLAQQITLSLLTVGSLGLLIIWLLPPFQGPDENRHWKAAVRKFRTDGQPGFVLHDLPDLLVAEQPRWRSETPFPADHLVGVPNRPHAGVEQENVGYAGPWAYPIVGLVSLCFPAVQSLPEALTFYYACRCLPLFLLCWLLSWLQHRVARSWILTIFVSMPLVLQQCVIVSTDTVPNLGTLAALALFARMRQQPSRWLWLALTIVVLAVILAKPPIYALLLVLPAWFLPWRKIATLPGFLAMLAILYGCFLASYFLLWKTLDRASQTLGEQAREQLRYVSTLEGISQFAGAASEYPWRCGQLASWCEPLGWLDTELSDQHIALISLSLGLAVILDSLRGGARLLASLRRRYGNLLLALGIVVAHALFTWLCLALIMYLSITPVRADYIVGMQVRYMFPVLFVALVLPSILMQEPKTDDPTHGRRNPPVPGLLAQIRWNYFLASQSLMIFFLIARCVQLAIDLQYRYGGK
jgi:hypothetical protein